MHGEIGFTITETIQIGEAFVIGNFIYLNMLLVYEWKRCLRWFGQSIWLSHCHCFIVVNIKFETSSQLSGIGYGLRLHICAKYSKKFILFVPALIAAFIAIQCIKSNTIANSKRQKVKQVQINFM